MLEYEIKSLDEMKTIKTYIKQIITMVIIYLAQMDKQWQVEIRDNGTHN